MMSPIHPFPQMHKKPPGTILSGNWWKPNANMSKIWRSCRCVPHTNAQSLLFYIATEICNRLVPKQHNWPRHHSLPFPWIEQAFELSKEVPHSSGEHGRDALEGSALGASLSRQCAFLDVFFFIIIGAYHSIYPSSCEHRKKNLQYTSLTVQITHTQ